MGKIDRGWIVRRDDHPHPDPRLVEHPIGKAEGHPHAAVRGRIPGQRPAVQRDAVPGDALHVRHMGIVIHVRAVVDLFIDNGEDAGRRLASLGAGRYGGAQDPALGVVDSDLLGLDRHDRHDRLACLARRRRLFGLRGARLPRRVGGQRRQCGHRRERHNGGRAPAPHSHGRLCRRKSIDHAMPGWNACPRLRRSGVKSRSLDNQQPTPYAANSFLETIARSVGNSLIYDSERTNEGWLAAEIGTKRTSPSALHMSAFDPKRTAKLYMTVAKRALSPVENSAWATYLDNEWLAI